MIPPKGVNGPRGTEGWSPPCRKHQNAVHAVSSAHELFPTISRKWICGAVVLPEDERFADHAPAQRRGGNILWDAREGTHPRPQGRKWYRVPGCSGAIRDPAILPEHGSDQVPVLGLLPLEDRVTNIRSGYFQNRCRGLGCDLRVNRDASNISVRKKAIYTWVEGRSGPEKTERLLQWKENWYENCTLQMNDIRVVRTKYNTTKGKRCMMHTTAEGR